MKFKNPSFKFFLNGRTNGRTNKRTANRKQYAPHFFKVGGIMKMGHTAVWDIKSSSVTLKTWPKEPEKNTVILSIFTSLSTQRLI